MAKGDTVTHEGKVLSVSGNGTAEVEILVSGACSGCHARSVCSAGRSESKVIMVSCDTTLLPGDHVTVEMQLSQGYQALLIGYILPFLVLVTVLAISLVAGAGELTAALVSFSATTLYYLLIWRLRERIGEKFEFKIKV